VRLKKAINIYAITSVNLDKAMDISKKLAASSGSGSNLKNYTEISLEMSVNVYSFWHGNRSFAET
jgi:hypothetical protein